MKFKSKGEMKKVEEKYKKRCENVDCPAGFRELKFLGIELKLTLRRILLTKFPHYYGLEIVQVEIGTKRSKRERHDFVRFKLVNPKRTLRDDNSNFYRTFTFFSRLSLSG